MTPRTYFQTHSPEHVEKMAKLAGTNFNNFRLIALYDGACSKHMAEKLETASDGEMTILEILFPDKRTAA